MRKRYYTFAEKQAFAKGCRVGARNAKKSARKRTSKRNTRKYY